MSNLIRVIGIPVRAFIAALSAPLCLIALLVVPQIGTSGLKNTAVKFISGK